MKSVKSLKKLRGKRVLLRIDTNVAVERGRVVADGTLRLDAVVSSISDLVKKGARVVLLGHRGRPSGAHDADLSLAPIARYLGRAIKKDIALLGGFDESVVTFVDEMRNGEVVMLENVRFHPGEERNSAAFAKWLARLGDVYVNDAFAVSHRKAASLVGVTKFLPSYAGLLLMHELKMFDEVLKKPKHPMVVVMGGVKAETKIPVIEHLLDDADVVCLGGALANSFYGVAHGYEIDFVSKSLQKDMENLLKHNHVWIPHDVVVEDKKRVQNIDLRGVSEKLDLNAMMDVGHRTAEQYAQAIMVAKTVVWNGPLGKFEDPRFAKGTRAIATAIRKTDAQVYVGGGESLQVVKKLQLTQFIHHVSTGGGAMLMLLAGKPLPAIEVLK